MHKVQQRWALTEARVWDPWKTRQLRCAPRTDTQVQVFSSGCHPGPGVLALCRTVQTTAHLLLTIWKLISNNKLRPSYAGTCQKQSQSLLVSSIRDVSQVSNYLTPPPLQFTLHLLIKLIFFLGRQTHSSEGMQGRLTWILFSITRSLMLSPYVFRPQTG